MMRRFVSRAYSPAGPMSPLSGPASPTVSALAVATRDKVSTPKSAKKVSATSPSPRKESSPPRTAAQKKGQMLSQLTSPSKATAALVGHIDPESVSSPRAVRPPVTQGQPANKTEQLLESFIRGFKKAVPPSDKATNVRIAQFEDKEFLFVAEPSTAPPPEEEAPTVVTLNSIIAEDLNLQLPSSLLLDGTETEAEAEILLEAREKEVMIKTDMTRQLRAKGFELEEIVEALNTLDSRLEVLQTAAAKNDEAKPDTEAIAQGAIEEFDATRQSFLKDQAQQKKAMAEGNTQAVAVEEEQPQPVDPALQAEVEKLQDDYNKIFQAEQPRLFMNFLQRGSFDNERNDSDRRVISTCTFLDRMAMEEAAEQQAAQQAQMELQQQAEAEAQAMAEVAAKKKQKGGKKTTKKATKRAKSNHQEALVGAVASEEYEPVVSTAVDTDHLGLAETAMKFYVNKGQHSMALEKSAGSPTDAKRSPQKLVAPQAGISLVALGVRMCDAKPQSPARPRVVSSHAYIIEGERVGPMKKKANDLYHPLLLSTVSSPGASSENSA